MTRPAAIVVCLAILLGSCSSRHPYEGKSVAELERMLKEGDPRAQAQAAYAAGLDADTARPLASTLLDVLKSPDAELRRLAAQALRHCGAADSHVVPALTAALDDSSWKVQRSAALALGHIGHGASGALAPLRKLSRSANNLVRRAARQAITQIEAGK